MFDFRKIKMKPSSIKGYKPAATDSQIAELEQYSGYTLPESYKTILRNYNGGEPEEKIFNIADIKTGIASQWNFDRFYHLDKSKVTPDDIWWIIENYAEYMGPNTIPFGDDGVEQIYYMKWVGVIPQIWHLSHGHRALDSFDDEEYEDWELAHKLLIEQGSNICPIKKLS